MRVRFLTSAVDSNYPGCFRANYEYDIDDKLANELIHAAVVVPVVGPLDETEAAAKCATDCCVRKPKRKAKASKTNEGNE